MSKHLFQVTFIMAIFYPGMLLFSPLKNSVFIGMHTCRSGLHVSIVPLEAYPCWHSRWGFFLLCSSLTLYTLYTNQLSINGKIFTLTVTMLLCKATIKYYIVISHLPRFPGLVLLFFKSFLRQDKVASNFLYS